MVAGLVMCILMCNPCLLAVPRLNPFRKAGDGSSSSSSSQLGGRPDGRLRCFTPAK